MKARKWIVIGLSVAVFGLVATGGVAAGWLLKQRDSGAKAVSAKAEDPDTRAYKYISLEKVIVMLRNGAGESVPHYMAIDLVFKTPLGTEAVTRDQLPLLRSVTVRALSNLTVESADHATVDQLTQQLNSAYAETYSKDRAGKPFSEALIGKLIIE